jgi:hypothetical protein
VTGTRAWTMPPGNYLAVAVAIFLLGLAAYGFWRGEMPLYRTAWGRTTRLPPLRGAAGVGLGLVYVGAALFILWRVFGH